MVDDEGPSDLAVQFMSKSRGHVKLVGRVNRKTYGRKKDMRDPYFATFIRERFNCEPETMFHKYALAQPTKVAGWTNLMKYDKPQPSYDKHAMDLAWSFARRMFSAMSGSKVMHDPEAVKSEMNMQASCGWPYNLFFSDKAAFFKEFEEVFGINPIEFLESYWEDIATETPRHVFWTNNVKEELRPIEKLLIGKLRTFVGSSIDHLWACIKMFGDQNQRFYSSTAQHWSFVGASKFYGGWNTMIRRLLRWGPLSKGFALDESEYDSSIFRDLLEQAALFRFEMLEEGERTLENWNRICNLYREVIYSLIVSEEGDVVMKETGNPSGFGNTIADNTIILFVLVSYAWIKIYEKRFGHTTSYEDLVRNVSAWLCGDDNTFCVSEELDTLGEPIISWFNARSIAEIWTSLGVITKTDDWEPRLGVELDFLSHTTAVVHEMFVPVPEYQKVMCSMAYHNPSPLNPKWSLLRCNALRIESFYNLECRQLLRDYRNWLLSHPEIGSLVRCPRGTFGDAKDIFDFSEIESVYKSDAEIEQLYLATEACVAEGSLLNLNGVLDKMNIHVDFDQAENDEIYDEYYQDVDNLANPDKNSEMSKPESAIKIVKKAKKAVKKVKKVERNVKRLEKAKQSKGLKTATKGNGLLGYRNSGKHKYGQMTNAYINTIVDPSQFAPVAIGFGSLTPGTLRTLYWRNSFNITASGLNAIYDLDLVLNPWSCLRNSSTFTGAASTNPTNALDYWFTQLCGTGSGTRNATSGFSLIVPSNYTQIVADTTEYRVVSAMIKVKVEYPETSTGPRMFAGRIVGCSNNSIDAFYANNFFQLPASNTGFSKGGVAMCQINYVPVDVADFAYVNTSANSSNYTGKINPIFIAINGLIDTCSVTIEVVQHIETQSGVLSVTQETSGMQPKKQGALSQEWATPEQMWPEISPIIEKKADKVMFNVNDMLMSGAKWLGKHALSALSGGLSDIFDFEMERKIEIMVKDPRLNAMIWKKLREKEEKEREDFVPSTPASGVVVSNASSVPTLASNESYFSKFQFGGVTKPPQKS